MESYRILVRMNVYKCVLESVAVDVGLLIVQCVSIRMMAADRSKNAVLTTFIPVVRIL